MWPKCTRCTSYEGKSACDMHKVCIAHKMREVCIDRTFARSAQAIRSVEANDRMIGYRHKISGGE